MTDDPYMLGPGQQAYFDALRAARSFGGNLAKVRDKNLEAAVAFLKISELGDNSVVWIGSWNMQEYTDDHKAWVLETVDGTTKPALRPRNDTYHYLVEF
ncbi:hypothetical protein ACWDYH_35585 [Nocardia goodfellowii]|uniref:hypothetical protein n=1 Tax=Nocardia sp. NPDC023852 TaxID=3154697 RepID=UPI0034012A13